MDLARPKGWTLRRVNVTPVEERALKIVTTYTVEVVEDGDAVR